MHPFFGLKEVKFGINGFYTQRNGKDEEMGEMRTAHNNEAMRYKRYTVVVLVQKCN